MNPGHAARVRDGQQSDVVVASGGMKRPQWLMPEESVQPVKYAVVTAMVCVYTCAVWVILRRRLGRLKTGRDAR